MEETDIEVCLTRKKKDWKNTKKNYREANKTKKLWCLVKQYINSFLIVYALIIYY